jgi:ribonuclease T1
LALRDEARARDQRSTVPFGALPDEAKNTSNLIRRGGPFPYRQDGVPFGNRERSLPAQQRGYYREYTVPTPHAHDRGARRIVCGGREPTSPDACYYTNDHYATFRLIVQ